MRMIGQLDGEAKARTFSDYLFVQGIENQIEADKDRSWSVWIHAEEELERAKGMLQRFAANPGSAEFQKVARTADALRDKKKEEQATYEKRVKERRQLFRPMTAYGFGPVTFMLIVMCVIVYIMRTIQGPTSTNILLISEFDIRDAMDVGTVQAFMERIQFIKQCLPEVQHGQLWRLFTPMFIHYGLLHIFFDMLWLRDLGSMVEGRQSSLYLIVMVLAVALVSNVAQYFVGGGNFGGMSGVVYGLFGYIWIRGKLDPGSGLYLHQTNVTMMIIWFFVCLAGFAGDIANTCHAAGLVMGMTWGWASSLRHR